jgi:hypothetical protein
VSIVIDPLKCSARWGHPHLREELLEAAPEESNAPPAIASIVDGVLVFTPGLRLAIGPMNPGSGHSVSPFPLGCTITVITAARLGIAANKPRANNDCSVPTIADTEPASLSSSGVFFS